MAGAAGADAGDTLLGRIAHFATGRRAVVLVGLWSFAEAIVLPIVPDVALDLFGLATPRRTPLLFAVAVAGALVGTAVLFALALGQLPAAQAMVLSLPGIQPSMLDAARSTVATGDPASIALFGPGTPLKVFTVAWPSGSGTVVALASGVVLNRLTRIGPALLIAIGLGAYAPNWLRRHSRLVLAVYTAGWVVLYAGYWSGAL